MKKQVAELFGVSNPAAAFFSEAARQEREMERQEADCQGKEMENQKVKVEFVRSAFLTRYPCHVCGGFTGKDCILAEVKNGEFKGFRVCECCLIEREFDAKLIKHAESLEADAAELRSLVGRLEVPTFEQYKAESRKANEEFVKAYDGKDGLEREDDERNGTQASGEDFNDLFNK